MRSQARNLVTWHDYKQRGQAMEGRGSLGGQAWINNEKQRASHADAFTYPEGGFFVIKSKLKLYTTEILLFQPQGKVDLKYSLDFIPPDLIFAIVYSIILILLIVDTQMFWASLILTGKSVSIKLAQNISHAERADATTYYCKNVSKAVQFVTF